MEKKILSIIPARGGSKGIPKKNIRLINHKPLIFYAIDLSKRSQFIDKTILSTDDLEISKIGEHFGVDEVIMRPSELAKDEVPLLPVLQHAYEKQNLEFNYVLSFQPTVPLLSLDSLNQGIQKALKNDADSVVFVTDKTAHYWKNTDSGFNLLSSSRTNRQYMEKIYEEIGVFLISVDQLKKGKMVGDNPQFQIVDEREGIDIDNYGDWVLAENYLKRKLIIYRVIGNSNTGLGHISRGLTIAQQIYEHDVLFAVNKKDDLALNIIKYNNFPYIVFDDEKEFDKIIDEKKPEIIINDILDTSKEYINKIKSRNITTINFEDMGEGSELADKVINALYEFSSPPHNHLYGHKYVCLRDEFRYLNEKKEIPVVNNIMISFGGVDENNLTLKALKAISDVILEEKMKNYHIDVVLGLGYKFGKDLNEFVNNISKDIDISLNKDVKRMSEHMSNADLLITSNGRTVYEATSINLPMISISQNERESKHLFSHICKGVWNLGLADFVTKENIKKAFLKYVENPDYRNEMVKSLDKYDIKNGIERVKELILN